MSEREEARAYVDAFELAWQECVNPYYSERPFNRAPDWEVSVRKWRDRGLSIDALIGAVDLAMATRSVKSTGDAKWRYVCGIAWKKINA